MIEKNYGYYGDDILTTVNHIKHTMSIGENHRFQAYPYEDVCYITFVSELYYMRNNSLASLTMTLFVEPDAISAYVVASGAGSGLFNFSAGAEKDIIKTCDSILLPLGFIEL